MIYRSMQRLIEKNLFKGKVIIILGARQVGKTTLIRYYQNKYIDTSIYLNCDEPKTRENLTTTDTEKLKLVIGNKKLLLIDEAQRVKNIGLTLKLLADNFNDVQVITSGSSSFELSNEINEPLTGRKYEYILHQFSIAELEKEYGYIEMEKKIERGIIYGMYPALILEDNNPEELLYNLAESYLYKDIFRWFQIRKPELLDKLLKALSLQLGNEVSYSELASLLKVKSETVSTYIQLLEKSFVIFRLGSFSRNLRTELKKSQKFYFWDTGIRNALIGDFSPLELRSDKGALWENFLISERLKRNSNINFYCNSYFWRTTQQQEIDYIEEYAGKISAYEIKYNPGKHVNFSKTFTSGYDNIEKTEVINSSNFYKFLSE